jgi:multiple sugar transport system substrate-binding protein
MSHNELSRRTFLKFTGISLGVITLAACAPAAAPQGQATTEGEAAPAEGVTQISFMGWGNPGEDEGVKNAIAQFEKENPNIKVEWLHTPDTNEYASKFLALVAAGTPPDTAFVGSQDYRTYIKDSLLLDITDFIEADPLIGAPDYFIEPQERDRCTQDGRWYGIGSCWVAPHIYYKAETFEEAGVEPPGMNPEEAWTWEQFLETARAMTVDVNGNHPGDAGFDVNNVDRWGVHWPTLTGSTQLHSAIASNGGDWIDPESGLIVLDKPEATQALQNIADLMLVHQVMPVSTALESLGMTNTQMLETGKLALAVEGSWALDWMKNIEGTLGTGVLPKMTQVATSMQAHLHSAMAATESPDAAWQWVRYLSTPFYQLQFCRTGLWLPSQTALATEEGLKEWMSPEVHPAGYEQMVTTYLPNYGHVLYMPPGYPKTNSIITPALDAVWVGDMTAEEAMATAVPEANAILEQEMSRS